MNIELGRVSAQEYRELPEEGIVVVLDNVRSAHNVGSVFRSADSFKVDRIVLCGICPTPPSAEIHKSALGAEDSVPWTREERTEDAVRRLREEGYTIVSVEQTVHSVKLDRFEPYGGMEQNGVSSGDKDMFEGKEVTSKSEHNGMMKKYALVFGNEVDGVSQEVVDLSDFALEIPQFGTKHSLNISVSAGVVLWHFRLSLLRHAQYSEQKIGKPSSRR